MKSFHIIFIIMAVTGSISCRDLTQEPGHLKPFGFGRLNHPVDEVQGFPDPETFFRNYVFSLKPLKMTGASKLSPAFLLWSDDYFLSLEESKDHNINVETAKKEKRTQKVIDMTFSDFLRVYNVSEKYMVDSVPEFLGKDVLFPCPVQCDDLMENNLVETIMWFSSGGTKSVVHFDTVDNINCLFRGEKELVFVDPSKYGDKKSHKDKGGLPYQHSHILPKQTLKWPDKDELLPAGHEKNESTMMWSQPESIATSKYLVFLFYDHRLPANCGPQPVLMADQYPPRHHHTWAHWENNQECNMLVFDKLSIMVDIDGPEGAYSTVDVDSVDYLKYPDLADVEFYHVNVSAGDCLYIPYRWIHQVRSYGSNLAINIWWNHQHNANIDFKRCNAECNTELTLDQVKFKGFGELANSYGNIRDHLLDFVNRKKTLEFESFKMMTLGRYYEAFKEHPEVGDDYVLLLSRALILIWIWPTSSECGDNTDNISSSDSILERTVYNCQGYDRENILCAAKLGMSATTFFSQVYMVKASIDLDSEKIYALIDADKDGIVTEKEIKETTEEKYIEISKLMGQLEFLVDKIFEDVDDEDFPHDEL
ncbi:hypothetical protein CHS0354_011438 [Potamilus streckersoni]|uniref:JmjC domain-containing protein n=1 Tax=Potamilus streckersoni TaxID=2493646 RepID=A0AAE0VYF2_9BIVA|nr:hypothetical protein CHS0354_011438 [Potamilus streckersoni]